MYIDPDRPTYVLESGLAFISAFVSERLDMKLRLCAEICKDRDFGGFCLSAGMGYSPHDVQQRLDADVGVAGL